MGKSIAMSASEANAKASIRLVMCLPDSVRSAWS
jgi:hypothetical protein